MAKGTIPILHVKTPPIIGLDIEDIMEAQGVKHDDEFTYTTRYTVDEAYTGAEAVAKVKAHRYDFIVMDLLMPEIDGFEAMREIRCWEDHQGAAPACIIIALTAWELKEAELESLLCGADAHLTKPISQTRLLDILDEHRKPH